MNIFRKYKKDFFIFALLIGLCFFMFFSELGSYGLIDIDETRYVNISQNMFFSKNYVTPYLNFELFLEKPPLYYWLIVASYKLFGSINEFTSRFPTAFLAAIGVFATYIFAFKISKSRYAAFLSSAILATSFWYALFAHIAILDLGFCVLSTIALYCGVLTLFCKKESSKICLWWLGYFFLALSVLQKGLIGILVPGFCLLSVFFAFKRIKEIFKPAYIIPGLLIFILVCAPWHWAIYNANGQIWFQEYIVKHHFARFLDSSMEIGRKQPFFFYVPVIIGGMLPWGVFCLSSLAKTAKQIYSSVKSKMFFEDVKKAPLTIICAISFLAVFIFFSISSTKLPTYILPAFPFVSILTGVFLAEYMQKNENKKLAESSALITHFLFLLAGFGALISLLFGAPYVVILPGILFILISVTGLILFSKEKKASACSIFIALSMALFSICAPMIFNFVINEGQNELEEYAQIAEKNGANLITLGIARKYSMLEHYKRAQIHFIPNCGDNKYVELKNILESTTFPAYLVIKNKKQHKTEYLPETKTVQKGKKYTLLEIKKPLP